MAIATNSECKDSGIFSFLQKSMDKINVARLKLLSMMVVAMVQTGSVVLPVLAKAMAGKAKKDSKVRRLQRFLAQYTLSWGYLVVDLLRMLGVQGPFVLIMDRTNWKFGESDINILMLSIAYKGVAIPVFWLFLDKRGNSNTKERVQLMQSFLACFKAEEVSYLLADREFIGNEWLGWLTKNNIRYYIRIKSNAIVNNFKGQYVKHLFRGIRLYNGIFRYKKYTIYGQKVYVSCFRGMDELVIVISQDYDAQAVTKYAQRWEIETMFKAFKTHGFNAEDTHITKTDRLEQLFAVMAIAFYWAYKTGVVKDATIEPIKIVTSTKQPMYSFFKYGFDCLQEAFQQADIQKIKFANQILSYT